MRRLLHRTLSEGGAEVNGTPLPPCQAFWPQAKTLMPGGFTPPEQIQSSGSPWGLTHGVGDGGGTIVATGTPEEVAACPESYTGHYLKGVLERG